MATETEKTVAAESVAVLRADGTLHIPDNVRRALGIADGERVTLRLTATGGTLTLHADRAIDPDDAWAYTPERIAAAKRAARSPSFTVSEEELERITEAEDPQEAARMLIAEKTAHG